MKPKLVRGFARQSELGPYVDELDGERIIEESREVYKVLNPSDKKSHNSPIPLNARTCSVVEIAPGLDMGAMLHRQDPSLAIALDLEFIDSVFRHTTDEKLKHHTMHHFTLSALTYSVALQRIIRKINRSEPHASLVKAWGWVGHLASSQMGLPETQQTDMQSLYRNEAIRRQNDYGMDMLVIADEVQRSNVPFPRIQRPVSWIGLAYPQTEF